LTLRVLLSCGEPSGDLYAGALTRELRAIVPGAEVFGLGGPQFTAAGGRAIVDYRGLSVTGLTEPIAKIPQLAAARRRLLASASETPPDVFVPIDFWGFNYGLARRIARRGVPVVYYIGPQLWASRPWRMKTMREVATRVLVIFPFEEAIYRQAGVPVEFVGHPLVDLARSSQSRAAFLTGRGLPASAPTVGILPGSRPSEVARILPDLVAAANLIRAQVPGAQFLVARAPNLPDSLFDVLRDGQLPRTVIVEADTDTVLASADVALTASGTATVQAALHDTPMVIVYRVSPWTYRLGRHLLNVSTFGMVNLIAGSRIVPELIQDAFTPAAVAAEAVSMLTDRARAAHIREGLRDVCERLGGGGASRRAAQAVVRMAGGASPQWSESP
jgi:lipid-A-disaccharide synthase